MTGDESGEASSLAVERTERLNDFQRERKRLVRLAYRMLGSFSEAEDAVQDAWFKWEKVEGGVDAPAAYLTRIVTRLCLDRCKSARVRRETYIGLSIGVQTGPPIGAQKGPPFTMAQG